MNFEELNNFKNMNGRQNSSFGVQNNVLRNCGKYTMKRVSRWVLKRERWEQSEKKSVVHSLSTRLQEQRFRSTLEKIQSTTPDTQRLIIGTKEQGMGKLE